MPKTYTQNLGITKPAEGEEDGVWGDLVNENMDIVDRAINGSISLTLTGTSSTLTTLDGDLSNGQYKVIRLTGTPSGTHTITITPNTAQKVYFVYNTTAQSVVFTQGSGGNVTIAAGDSGVIYSSGIGATSAVVNLTDHFAMNSVNITGGSISGVATIAATTGSFTTGVFGLGAVGTPSITFSGDTNTGIFSPGADTLAFVEGGVEAMRISNAGFVGIGTNAPGTLLDVNGTTRTSSLFFPSTSNQVEVRAGNTTSFHDTDFTQLTTAAAGVRFFRNTNTTGGSSVRFFRGDGTATEDARVGVGAVDSFFATASGRLGVGIVLPVNKLHVVSAPPMSVPAAGATGHALGVGAHPYGLALGVLDNGTSYLQSTRWDGTPTNYNLILQPNGGDTGIGTSTVSGIFGRTLQIGDGSTFASINLPGTGAGTTGDLILYSGASSATIAARAATDLILATGDVERMRIDSAGNLGLGVTPSAWVVNARALDISSFLSLWQQSNGATNLGFGVYEGAVNGFRYKSTGDAPTLYSQLTGAHRWFTAPSGTVGTAITFTQAMTLDAAGNLGIGLTSPAVNLDIGGSAAPTVRTLSTTNAVDTRMVSFGGSGTAVFGTFSNHPLAFFANNGERARIHASGGVSIGNSSDPGAGNLSVTGNILIPAATTETRAIEIGANRAGNGTSFIDLIGDATYSDYGARLARGATGANTDTILYHRGTGALQLLAQEAGIIALYTSATERVRLSSAGDLGVGTTNPLERLHVNTASGAAGIRLSVADVSYGNLFSSVSGTTLSNITAAPLIFSTTNTERFRIGPAGQLGIGGATYGTAGQVLTSGGPSAAPSWTSVVASGGTVTSVAVSGGTTGLTTSGGPVTTSGTITLAGTLALTNGGTGATTDVGARSNLGLGTMATQGSSAVTITGGSITGITDLTVADGGTGASDAATARTNLGLAIGTNVQAYDAGLQSIAGLTTVADRMIYTTASDVYAVTTLTAAGRAILDDADAAAQRTTLGLGTIATQGADTVAITGGTINATTIGATTAAAGTFTTGTFTTSVSGLGTAALPSRTFTGDTNTGIWSPGADTLAVSTAGTERLRIDASGNLGLGVTPSAWGSFRGLDIGTSGGISSLTTTTHIGSNWFFNGTNYVRKAVGFAPMYFLDAATGNHDFYAPGTGAAASTFAPGTAVLSLRNGGVAVVPGTLQVTTITNSGATRGPNFSKAYVETVFALTGTTPALDPANGGIQTWTLTANSTPTDSVQAGESLTLLVDDGTAFTVTWPSVTWKTNGGVAPTLLTTGLTVIVLWKVGTVLYGARVGDA